MTAVFTLIAAVATLYATASLLTGFDADFTVAALIAVLSLAVVILIEDARHMRELRRRERAATWLRRDREAGL